MSWEEQRRDEEWEAEQRIREIAHHQYILDHPKGGHQEDAYNKERRRGNMVRMEVEIDWEE